ncbi:hypothetical protein BH24ACT13_BH24ACT13_10340 [soil metagenome]
MAGESERPRGASRLETDTPRVVDREVTDVRPGSLTQEHEVTERPVVYERPVQQEPVEQTPVNVSVAGRRGDQVRWGPVWAGLMVALATFLLLELAFYAFGWLTPGSSTSEAAGGVITGILGLVAFFLGGLVAGASAMWKSLSSGLLNGLLVWALGVVGLLFLTLFGGGALLGSFGNIAAQVVSLGQVPDVSAPEAQEAIAAVRDAARWAVLGLALSLAAAAIGGIVGAKMWPRNQDDQDAATTVG